MSEQWYLIDDIDKIDSPALVIYLDRVKHNIALAIQMVNDPLQLRPHVKTHKSPQVTALMLHAGITKFKCATIAEAEMLAQCDAPDILLAYQPTGPKIQRLLKLVQNYPHSKFSCLIDSEDAANAIAKQATEQGQSLKVFIDVNVGMNRTGILPQNVLGLYNACKKLKGIDVTGLHGYDGHINDTDITARKQKADEVFHQLEEAKETLISAGLEQPVIVIGGSPTFSIHAKRENVECSPGTFVYWDKNYSDQFPDMNFLPAALVISRVVSIVNEKRICIDLGHKSIASENVLGRRVYFLNAEEFQPVGQSEEHLVMETHTPHHYKVGDVLYGMPHHVCPTCALYDTASVIENGIVKEEWQMVARDRKLLV